MFPNGTIFSISSALKAAIAVTSISNANPAVATVDDEGAASGDIVMITSDWGLLDGRVARLSAATAVSATLEGIDTTDANAYAAGGGAGSLRAVQTWVELSKVTASSRAGGEQQFHTWQYLEDRAGRQRQAPTFKNAKSLTLTLDHDPAKSWFKELIKADAQKDRIILRAVLPNGAKMFYPVTVSFDADPSLDMNVTMANTVTFAMDGEFTRYEA